MTRLVGALLLLLALLPPAVAQEPPARWALGVATGGFVGGQAGVEVSRRIGTWRVASARARWSVLGTYQDLVPNACQGHCSSLSRRRSRATSTLEVTSDWGAPAVGVNGWYGVLSGGISATSWRAGSHGYSPPVVYAERAITGAPLAGAGAGRQFRLLGGSNRVEVQVMRFFDHDMHLTTGRLSLSRIW